VGWKIQRSGAPLYGASVRLGPGTIRPRTARVVRTG